MTKNRTKSCGCLNQKPAFKDLSNQRFGKLVAIEPTYKKNKHRSMIWKCKCDCGNDYEIAAENLLKGTKSCGCLSTSYGAYSIEQILKNNNIYFEKEKTFNTCKFDDTQYLARFDFFVENKYIVEFDGIQHFEPRCFGGINEGEAQKAFEKVIKHDKYKNNWCKQNNIPLIRIPYWHKNIQLKDLILEESEFIYE